MTLKASIRLAFAFAVILIGTEWATAHDSSVTKVHAKLSAGSVEATFEFIPADVLHFVLGESDRHEFLDQSEVTSATARIADYAKRRVELRLDGKITAPESTRTPTTTNSAFDPAATVPLTMHWAVPAGARQATLSFDLFDKSGFAAIFELSIERNGVQEPYLQYLHVNETATLDLPQPVGASGAAPVAAHAPRTMLETAIQFLKLGFTHIVPNGLDHILFVIGLYFLSPKLKPLFTQVTAFTVAHSITLALSVLGYVSLPGRIVEPLIAISITAVALENIFTRRVHAWRWAIVFGFGLIHGLGFAGILRETSLPRGGMAAALVSFNVGVELGQLTVIAAVFAVTVWFQKRWWYFRYVSAPASALIACIGLFWTVQRVFFP